MKNILSLWVLSILLTCVGCTNSKRPGTSPNCYANPQNNVHQNGQWKTECISVDGVKLRAGIYSPTQNKPRANLLYLEGLADSMLNHDILIKSLSSAGYRVIAFDYPGQGGSAGSMNQTRVTLDESSCRKAKDWFQTNNKQHIEFEEVFERFNCLDKDSLTKPILISHMADEVWKQIKKTHNIDEKEQVDVVIGWSTGGLAALKMASQKCNFSGLKAIVLIAPGTNVKPVTKISAETLNSNTDFEHVDEVWPTSPIVIPHFATNLFVSGYKSQHWKVSKEIRGLVLLSGQETDKYVDIGKVKNTIQNNAEHFQFVNYVNSAHEIDNETEANRTGDDGIILENKVVEFLNGILPKL